MKRLTWISLVGALAITGAASVVPAAQAAPANQDMARLMVVQALPGTSIEVDLGDELLSDGVATGEVLGPYLVPAGEHRVTFRDASGVVVETTVDLAEGSTQDLVIHRPAQVDGAPVATVYETPTTPIAADKARVLIAHTAAVAPADVRLDGAVVFRNIANGEYATADVAEGAHVAELLPSGVTTRPILGPLDVDLGAATATMVYAVGTGAGSMSVISHSIDLEARGGQAPTSITAGSAGLAAGLEVQQFGGGAGRRAEAGPANGPVLLWGGLAMGLTLFTLVLQARRRVPVDASS